MPPGEARPPHEMFRRAWEAAETVSARERVLEEARAELDRLRGRNRPERPAGETTEQWKARLLKDGEGHDSLRVAQEFNTSQRRVRRIRLDDKRDPETGKKTAGVSAAEMRRQGLSYRQIAELTGRGLGSVHRDLTAA